MCVCVCVCVCVLYDNMEIKVDCHFLNTREPLKDERLYTLICTTRKNTFNITILTSVFDKTNVNKKDDDIFVNNGFC